MSYAPGVPRASPPPPPPEAPGPPYLCETCGRDHPVEKVWQCTLCLKYYCLDHLNLMAHDCIGALGKRQTIGVTGQ